MKILLSSHFFHPSVGGIEVVSEILAREFTQAGHEVKVITQTAAADGARFPFDIYRRPGRAALWRLVSWCDVFFHNNISLQVAWPLLLLPRPWVVAHHTWLTRVDGAVGWRDRLKRFAVRRAQNIAVSEAVRARLGVPAIVIGNPYRDDLFRIDATAVRDRDLIFVGRLVSDKGLDLLLEALARLKTRGIAPSLTVVGSGPEEATLRELSARLCLNAQVTFAGTKVGAELVALLNHHRIIVVPSRWQEPFGLVALEGMACGCLPLVAACGGLPDAVGDAGLTFAPEDADDAAASIEKLLGPNADLDRFRRAADAHLTAHRASAAAQRYLQVIEEAVRR